MHELYEYKGMLVRSQKYNTDVTVQIMSGQSWDEIEAAAKLSELREQQEHYTGPSFTTISAFGPNGAVIHYRPRPDTNLEITKNSLYLVDSGGQYKGEILSQFIKCLGERNQSKSLSLFGKGSHSRHIKGYVQYMDVLFTSLGIIIVYFMSNLFVHFVIRWDNRCHPNNALWPANSNAG